MTDTGRRITVVVAEPDQTIRAHLVGLLADSIEAEIIGEAETDEDAINMILDLVPDIALVGTDPAPTFDGRTVCLVAGDKVGATRLVAVAADEGAGLYASLRSGGFSTYILDPEPGPEPGIPEPSSHIQLPRVVWGAARDESNLSSGAASWLLAEYEHLSGLGDELLAPAPELRDEERSVLEGLAAGRAPSELATESMVTLHAVGTWVGCAIDKLHRSLRVDRELRLLR